MARQLKYNIVPSIIDEIIIYISGTAHIQLDAISKAKFLYNKQEVLGAKHISSKIYPFCAKYTARQKAKIKMAISR